MDKIDYIIPTWNSSTTLGINLASIMKYGNSNNIIVVDRKSNDRTLDIAKAYGCTIVSFSGPLGAARRLGARHAKTELIAFIDSDVELTARWEEILKVASEKAYPDAGAISGYYSGEDLSERSLPIRLMGGNGAFGCMVTYKELVLEFEGLDKYSSAEDNAYARFLSNKGLYWYILPVELPHHHNMINIPDDIRWRWLGAGLRVIDGFKLRNVKRILGGAIFGKKMSNANIGYWENFKIRYNYFMGYLRYKKYYEIDRSGAPQEK